MRWVHRIFAILTIGPIVLWLAAVAGVILLGGVFNYNINEGGVQPCLVVGRDLVAGPVAICAGILWAMVAIVARLNRRRHVGRD